MLKKDTMKIINAKIPNIINDGEYWVMRNPARIATSRNDITDKNERTPYLLFFLIGIRPFDMRIMKRACSYSETINGF